MLVGWIAAFVLTGFPSNSTFRSLINHVFDPAFLWQRAAMNTGFLRWIADDFRITILGYQKVGTHKNRRRTGKCHALAEA
jgi:hypothetical protein